MPVMKFMKQKNFSIDVLQISDEVWSAEGGGWSVYGKTVSEAIFKLASHYAFDEREIERQIRYDAEVCEIISKQI